MYQKKPLLILTGPTAVGKTELSVKLAKAIGGEIISADSMQVYRHMDIGSAKVTKAEMASVPHYLVDEISPFEEFHVVRFQQLARGYLEEIYKKGKIPIIVGGTGFYIQALLYDIDFSEGNQDDAFREQLEQAASLMGPEYLHRQLQEIDPEAAGKIHPNNVKRVIRAIEFYHQTGKKISEHNEAESHKESPYDFLYFVLNMDRQLLYERINARVDLMMEKGLLAEVEGLSRMGLKKEMVSMQGLGYKELISYLEGEITLEEAVYLIKRDTRHFAKRQLTWFARERDVTWLELASFGFDRDLVLEEMVAMAMKKWKSTDEG